MGKFWRTNHVIADGANFIVARPLQVPFIKGRASRYSAKSVPSNNGDWKHVHKLGHHLDAKFTRTEP